MAKTLTVCTASARPGTCGTCRHANQATADFAEGRVCCAWDQRTRAIGYRCNLALDLPRDAAWKTLGRYYRYEPYDAKNGTWDRLEDARFVAVDAEPELKAHLLQLSQTETPAGHAEPVATPGRGRPV